MTYVAVTVAMDIISINNGWSFCIVFDMTEVLFLKGRGLTRADWNVVKKPRNSGKGRPFLDLIIKTYADLDIRQN